MSSLLLLRIAMFSEVHRASLHAQISRMILVVSLSLMLGSSTACWLFSIYGAAAIAFFTVNKKPASQPVDDRSVLLTARLGRGSCAAQPRSEWACGGCSGMLRAVHVPDPSAGLTALAKQLRLGWRWSICVRYRGLGLLSTNPLESLNALQIYTKLS